MRDAAVLLISTALLAACGAPTATGNNVSSANAISPGNSAAPANSAAPTNEAAASGNAAATQRETVTGTFAGWEMGDYLWARIAVPGGEPFQAMVQGQRGDPIALFLEANRGRPVTVEVTTGMMNIPEAGGEMEMSRITAARNAAGTAQAWLAGLSAAERSAIQNRFEENALSGNAR